MEKRWLASHANKDAIERNGGGRRDETAGGEKNRVVPYPNANVVAARGSRRLLTVGVVVGDGYPERRGNACAAPRRRPLSHPTRDPFFSPPTSLTREFLSFFFLSPSLSLSLPPVAEVQQPCIRDDVLPGSASQPYGFRSIAGISRCLGKSAAWMELREIFAHNCRSD